MVLGGAGRWLKDNELHELTYRAHPPVERVALWILKRTTAAQSDILHDIFDVLPVDTKVLVQAIGSPEWNPCLSDRHPRGQFLVSGPNDPRIKTRTAEGTCKGTEALPSPLGS